MMSRQINRLAEMTTFLPEMIEIRFHSVRSAWQTYGKIESYSLTTDVSHAAFNCLYLTTEILKSDALYRHLLTENRDILSYHSCSVVSTLGMIGEDEYGQTQKKSGSSLISATVRWRAYFPDHTWGCRWVKPWAAIETEDPSGAKDKQRINADHLKRKKKTKTRYGLGPRRQGIFCRRRKCWGDRTEDEWNKLESQKGHYEDHNETWRITHSRPETGSLRPKKPEGRLPSKIIRSASSRTKTDQDILDEVVPSTNRQNMSGKGRKLPGGGSTSRRRGPQAFPDVISREEMDRILRQRHQEAELLRKQTAEAQQRAYLAALKADAAYQNVSTIDRELAGEDNDVGDNNEEGDNQQSGGDYSEDEEGDNEEVQNESEES
ncbi:hypothetical protein Tco_0290558 [Tanacetum coccineum]